MNCSPFVPSADAVMPVPAVLKAASVVGLIGFCLTTVVPATPVVTVAAAVFRTSPAASCALVAVEPCEHDARRISPGPLTPALYWTAVIAVEIDTPLLTTE